MKLVLIAALAAVAAAPVSAQTDGGLTAEQQQIIADIQADLQKVSQTDNPAIVAQGKEVHQALWAYLTAKDEYGAGSAQAEAALATFDSDMAGLHSDWKARVSDLKDILQDTAKLFSVDKQIDVALRTQLKADIASDSKNVRQATEEVIADRAALRKDLQAYMQDPTPAAWQLVQSDRQTLDKGIASRDADVRDLGQDIRKLKTEDRLLGQLRDARQDRREIADLLAAKNAEWRDIQRDSRQIERDRNRIDQDAKAYSDAVAQYGKDSPQAKAAAQSLDKEIRHLDVALRDRASDRRDRARDNRELARDRADLRHDVNKVDRDEDRRK